MSTSLYYNTVNTLLHDVLNDLMKAKEFDEFRLVGGTSLSLQIGHRLSVDIDLFTDALYDSIDFDAIDLYLNKRYAYVDGGSYTGPVGNGKSYFVGNNKDDVVKVDLFYTDKFIQDILLIDGIRLASVEEILSMKMDVISRGGRKKDFWDVHELTQTYTIDQMIFLHKERHPYTHNEEDLRIKFFDFTVADEDLDPICLKEKQWKLIKLDLLEFITS